MTSWDMGMYTNNIFSRFNTPRKTYCVQNSFLYRGKISIIKKYRSKFTRVASNCNRLLFLIPKYPVNSTLPSRRFAIRKSRIH